MRGAGVRAIQILFMFTCGSCLIAQTCIPGWGPGCTTLGGIQGGVTAYTEYDADGPGPAPKLPVIGGSFGVAIGDAEGANWRIILVPSSAGGVTALATHDFDGPGPGPVEIVAAGRAGTFVSQYAAPLGRWNGTTWSTFGTDLTGWTYPAPVTRMIEWDMDGAGPGPAELIMGGGFTAPSMPPAFGVARYGGSWSALSPLGSGGTPRHTSVDALMVWDDDGNGPNPPALVIGSHSSLRGTTSSSLVRWDGLTSTPLGQGFNGAVLDLAVFDDDGPGPHVPALFASGSFTLAGGVSAPRVARWNGSAWSATGFGVGSAVRTITPFDLDGPGPLGERLIAGGEFTTANGANVGNVASFDGTNWIPVSFGLGVGGGATPIPTVAKLASLDADGAGPGEPRLLAFGNFVSADGAPANSVAIWDRVAWRPTGHGFVLPPRAMAVFDADGPGAAPATLYLAAPPVQLTTMAVSPVRAWTGSALYTVPSPALMTVNDLIVGDPDGPGPLPNRLIAGGAPTLFAAPVTTFDGTAWTQLPPLPAIPPYTGVRAMTFFDDDGPGPSAPKLVAADDGHVARFDGVAWSPVGVLGSSYGAVRAIAAFDDDGAGPRTPALYLGGSFSTLAGAPSGGISRWNGYSWVPIGVPAGVSTAGGAFSSVNALLEYDPDGAGPRPGLLVVGGDFDTAGGVPALGIAAWNGSGWSAAFGSGVVRGNLPGTVSAMAVADLDGNPGTPDELVVAGSFTSVSGIAAESIAHWNGTSWAPFGGGITALGNSVHFAFQPAAPPGIADLAMFDEDGSGGGSAAAALHVCGQFLTAGGVSAPLHARWGTAPGLSLSLTRAGPNAPLLFTDSACAGLDTWFNAMSLDPMNAAYPNTGPWFGLHIGPTDLLGQFQSGVAPFRGTLNAIGNSVTSAPASTLIPYSGVRVWSVGVRFDAPSLTVHGVSPVTSIQL